MDGMSYPGPIEFQYVKTGPVWDDGTSLNFAEWFQHHEVSPGRFVSAQVAAFTRWSADYTWFVPGWPEIVPGKPMQWPRPWMPPGDAGVAPGPLPAPAPWLSPHRQWDPNVSPHEQTDPGKKPFPWPETYPLPNVPAPWPGWVPLPIGPAPLPAPMPDSPGNPGTSSKPRPEREPDSVVIEQTAGQPVSPPRLGRHVRQRPPKGTKEKKITIRNTSPLFAFLFDQFGKVTEVMDLVDSFWKALPKEYRGGSWYDAKAKRWKPRANIQERAMLVYRHWDKVDLAQAIQNVISDNLQDRAIGQANRQTIKNLRESRTGWSRPTLWGGWAG